MPIEDHDHFKRPAADRPLWRYTDIPKFLELITSGKLWLTNLEVLAKDDPFEGSLGSYRFPHRIFKSAGELPDELQLSLPKYHSFNPSGEGSIEEVFKNWFQYGERHGINLEGKRRDFYINCWHEADHESIAMWKIYGSPGAGVAIVSNAVRLETALRASPERLFFGKVSYHHFGKLILGGEYLEHTVSKLSSYEYEREVRLVHWDIENAHHPLANCEWNDVSWRFEKIEDELSPVKQGLKVTCQIEELIEEVVVSPFAPAWYLPMLVAVRDKLGYQFQISASPLLSEPLIPV